MKHVILVNPMAGKKKGTKYGVRVQQLLKKYNIEAILYTSFYPGEFTTLTKRMSSETQCRFYSIGGDGTLNEIMQGIIGTNSDMVALACGTGNDFVKSVSSYLSMRKIIQNSINKVAQPVDVIKINKDTYCLNILSVGIDAIVGQNVDKFRWVPFINGKAKYNLSIFYTLLSNRNFKFKIRLNDTIYKQNFTLVAVSNGKYYGGGICPSIDANVSDGILDICLIDATTLTEKLTLLPKYKKGKHQALKQVHLEKTKQLSIVSTKPITINIDGEIYSSKKLKIQVIPNAVNVVFT